MLNIEGIIYRPDIQTGKSFVNDLKTYEWPEFHDEEGEAFLTEADWHGEPLREGMLMFYYRSNSKKPDRYHLFFTFPKEILEQPDYKKFIASVKEREKIKWSERVN